MKNQKTNPEKKRQVLIVFDNMVSDLEASKRSSSVVNELKNHQRFTCFYITILFESA